MPAARLRAAERPRPVDQRWDLRGSGFAHPAAKRHLLGGFVHSRGRRMLLADRVVRRGDALPPCVAWFIVVVGGCCGFPDSAAAADAAVRESPAPMAEVGGCCPVVVPVGPAVGPDPASRDASSLVKFSISDVHGPAAAVASGNTTTAQAPMTFSPDEPYCCPQRCRVPSPRSRLICCVRMASWSDKGMSRNGSALRIISASGRLMALPFPNPEPRTRSTACKDSRAMSIPRCLTIRLQ